MFNISQDQLLKDLKNHITKQEELNQVEHYYDYDSCNTVLASDIVNKIKREWTFEEIYNLYNQGIQTLYNTVLDYCQVHAE